MIWPKWLNTALKNRIIILLLVIFLLIVGSLVAFYWDRNVQQQNLMTLTLASRQRALVEQMTREVAEIEFDRDDRDQHIEVVQRAANTFEQTLWALTEGGQATYLPDQPVAVPAAQDPDIQRSLHQVHHTWDIFRGYLNEIISTDPADPNFTAKIRAVERLSPKLSREIDQVILHCQAVAEQENTLFWWVEGAIFAGILIFVGASYQLSKNSILKPLRKLESIIERMGQGDLNTPIMVKGPREIEAISHSLDTMRTQLNFSRSEMNNWVEQLESRAAQRGRELNAVFDLSQEIVNEPNLEQFLTSITDRAKTLTGAQVARLCVRNENRNVVIPTASSGNFPAATDSQELPACKPDIQLINIDPKATVEEMLCSACAFPENDQSRHCLVTPLRTGERTIGGLCVVRTTPKSFDADEVRALTLLANSAAIAISNVMLIEAGRYQAEQAASLIERENLAANLHDDLAQNLAYLISKADLLKGLISTGYSIDVESQLDQMRVTLNKAYTQVRATLVDLREPVASRNNDDTSPVVVEKTLAEELTCYLADFDQEAINTSLTITDTAVLTLSPKIRIQALHIVREALHNVRKHAQARQVSVHIGQADRGKAICFTIKDDGRGFDPATVKGENHIGLSIMRARAERSGGRLVIDSAPNSGTKISTYFPLSQN